MGDEHTRSELDLGEIAEGMGVSSNNATIILGYSVRNPKVGRVVEVRTQHPYPYVVKWDGTVEDIHSRRELRRLTYEEAMSE